MLVIPAQISLDVLAELISTGRLLDGVKIGLFGNDLHPSSTTVLADIVPSTFNGYALSSAVVWGTPYFDQAGIATVVAGDKQFTCTTPLAAPEQVFGYYIVDGAGAILIAAARFDTPVQIIIVGNAVVVVPTIQLQSQAG